MISGARYHRVATYSVMNPWFPALLLVPPPGVKLNTTLIWSPECKYIIETCAPPSQAKVAYFELAVCVDEKIAGLEIAVEHVGTVNVFKPAEGLVEEGLEVCVGERLSRPDLCANAVGF
jgi:hypothetical protein